MIRMLLLIACLFSSLCGLSQEKAFRIAVIDLERLIQECSQGRQMMEALAASVTEGRAKMEVFEASLKDHEAKTRDETLSEIERRKHARLYEDTARMIARHRKDQESVLQDIELTGLKQAEAELMPILERFTKEMSLDVIVDRRSQNLVYYDEAVDYTDMVLKRLK